MNICLSNGWLLIEADIPVGGNVGLNVVCAFGALYTSADARAWSKKDSESKKVFTG